MAGASCSVIAGECEDFVFSFFCFAPFGCLEGSGLEKCKTVNSSFEERVRV